MVPIDQQDIRITASIGAMAWHPELRDAEHWMHRADMALYRAKADGRNRVIIEQPIAGLDTTNDQAAVAHDATAQHMAARLVHLPQRR